MSARDDDLIGDIIAEIARTHGIAISRDDPIIAVVLLNQVVLRRYLEETVAPVAAAIREAADEAVARIEQFAEAQATWLEQVSLKDRTSFLDEQKALHAAWKADMAALIEGQNTALQRVVSQTIVQLRTKPAEHLITAPTYRSPSSAPQTPRTVPSWLTLVAGLLLGSGAMGAIAWGVAIYHVSY